MEKIGFIGAYDKSNLIIYVSKILELIGKKVLVVDGTCVQKTKYVVPSINPTKSYITSFQDVDFAVGFENWNEIERYLGIKFDTNDEDSLNENEKKEIYDLVLIDVDSIEKMESFEIDTLNKLYFVTSFDLFSLRKGLSCFQNLKETLNITKILFSYEQLKEDEEYLDFISMKLKIKWNEYALYFHILGDDNKVFEENQKLQKLQYRKLSNGYKESLAYLIQDIDKSVNISQVKKHMRD